jgi:hypothetical protein
MEYSFNHVSKRIQNVCDRIYGCKNLIYLKKYYFFNHFNILISKLIFKNNKKYYFNKLINKTMFLKSRPYYSLSFHFAFRQY